jgi:hypothetical protein
MYEYVIHSNGGIFKVGRGETTYFGGVFIVLDHFPTEQEYFDALDSLVVDSF